MEGDVLDGMTIAILVADGFEQAEMSEPRKALIAAGARTRVVSPNMERVTGWNHKAKEWAKEVPVDLPLAQAKHHDFDALLVPGGVMSPDALRTDERAVGFVKAFFQAHKPVASICHGPWMIIEAGEARWRRIAAWPSLKTDLRNAGAEWMDWEVVIDANLVTSRKPDDLPAFNREMVALFSRERERALHPA